MPLFSLKKSIYTVAIIGYFVWVIMAGIVNFLGYPWAYLTRPWSQYNMVAGSSSLHRELVAHAVLSTGQHMPISFENVFPMSPFLIERGEGLSISALLLGFSKQTRPSAMKKLCSYMVDWYAAHYLKNSEQIRSVAISRRVWPLEAGEGAAENRLLARCSSK